MSPAVRAYGLVMAVALAASATNLRNGFVYDDVPVVQQDPRIRSLAELPQLVAVPYWNDAMRDRIYRPATTVSFATDWAAGSGSPVAFHLTNVLLHVVVCALVLALARLVLGAGPAAIVAALWFAVHPVHVEAVANVVGRSELLAALGYLGATVAWVAEGAAAAASPGGGRRAVLAAGTLVGAAVAYGAKEHALTLPAALLLMDGWTASKRGVHLKEVFAPHAVTWAGTVALAAAYLAARHAVLGTTFGGGSVAPGLVGLSLGERALVMAPAMLVWARVLVLPMALSADYSPNHFVPAVALTPTHLLGMALVAVAVGIAVVAWRRERELSLGLLWLALTAAIATNVVFATGVVLAERVLYLPSAGAALVLGALWSRLSGRLVWPVTAIALTLLAARTLERNSVWRDGERFYAALVRDAPDSYRSHWATGARAFDRHQLREGEAELLTAVRIYPGEGTLLQELGEHYLAAGLNAPADRYLTAALRVEPTRADAATSAVIARTRLGQADSAVALGDAALRFNPTAPSLLLATSDAWFSLGKPAQALARLHRIVLAYPANWRFQYVVASGAARAGRCDEARLRADRAVSLAPVSASAPRELRRALGQGPTCRVAA